MPLTKTLHRDLRLHMDIGYVTHLVTFSVVLPNIQQTT